MKCSYCGANIPDGELYCPECGTEVQIVPDYNPLEDVLAKQVKGSIDGSTRPLDLYEDEDFQQSLYDTQARRRQANRNEGNRQTNGRSRRDAQELRRQQMARKKALAKKRRARLLIIMALILLAGGIVSFLIYQTSYPALMKKGDTALGQKDYATANDYYSRAEEKDVTKADAYTGLANVFLDQGDQESAENVFLDAITLQASNTNLYKACIQFYVKTKQVAKIPLLIDNCDDETVVNALNDYVCDVPAFSLEEGTYDDVQEVSLVTDDGLSIYYTIDGTDPSTASTKYADSIQLDEGTTIIKAIAVNKNKIPSMIETRSYTIELPVADAPAVSPSTGQHSAGTEITIQVPEDYTAYYTTDGTDPTSGSNKYSEPISMPEGQTVFKAVLINAKGKSTQITTRTYITE